MIDPSEQTPARLRALVDKWRKKSPSRAANKQGADDYWAGRCFGVNGCADDLEALLVREVPPVEAQEKNMTDNLRELLASLNVAIWGSNGHTYPPGVVDRLLVWLRTHGSKPTPCVKCGRPATICQGDYDIIETAMITAMKELDRLAAACAPRTATPQDEGAQVLQAVLDAINGTLDTSTQIADHPNVKFAQMKRLDLLASAARVEATEQLLAQVANDRDRVEAQRDAALRAASPASVEAAAREGDKLRRQLEIEKRAYDRLALCPDYRDKANGRCIVCVAEERTKAELEYASPGVEAAAPQEGPHGERAKRLLQLLVSVRDDRHSCQTIKGRIDDAIALFVALRSASRPSPPPTPEAAAPRDQQAGLLERLTNAARTFVVYSGGLHGMDCPADDTCACWGKPVNDAVNAAIREAETHLAACGAASQEPTAMNRESFADMDARIAAEVWRDELDEGVIEIDEDGTVTLPLCKCGVRRRVSHYCSALDHCWIGASEASAAVKPQEK